MVKISLFLFIIALICSVEDNSYSYIALPLFRQYNIRLIIRVLLKKSDFEFYRSLAGISHGTINVAVISIIVASIVVVVLISILILTFAVYCIRKWSKFATSSINLLYFPLNLSFVWFLKSHVLVLSGSTLDLLLGLSCSSVIQNKNYIKYVFHLKK